MSSRLAASILVRLIDQASGPAGKIAGALRSVDKVARSLGKNKVDLGVTRSSAANMDRMAASIRRLSRDMKSVGKLDFRVPPSSVNSLRQASVQARRLTSDLRAAAAAARGINVNLGGMRGSPFSGMRRDLQAALRDMQRLNALSRSVGRGGRGGGGGGYGPGGYPRGRRGHSAAEGYVAVRAAEAAAGGARRAAGFVGRAGANSMREDARDYLAGLTPADTERLHKTSVARSAEYKSVDATTLHEMLRDTAMSMGSVDKSVENSDNLARMAVVMQSMKGPEQAIENVRRFYSALDVLGKNIDPAQVKKLSNAYTKAQGVEGAELDMNKVLTFARQARAGGGSLSDDFLMYAAPALMQDLGPSGTGTAIASGLSQTVGGRATVASKTAQAAIGLRDAQGNMSKKDTDLYVSNPQKYAEDVLIPALQKGGSITTGKGKKRKTTSLAGVNLDDEGEVNAIMQKLYSNRVVADLFTKLINQRAQYSRKRQQYDAAPGTDAAAPLGTKDPYVAIKGLVSQSTNVASELVRPYMQTFTDAVDKASSAVGSFGKSMAENPDVAKLLAPAVTAVGAGLAAFVSGTALRALAGNGTGLAANAARLAGTGLVGTAGAIAATPLIGGAVAGAAMQESDTLNEGLITNGLMGRKSPTVRLIEEYAKSIDDRRATDEANKAILDAKMGAFDRTKNLGSFGSSQGDYATTYAQSRDSAVDNFLFGAQRGTVNLPTFGFQKPGAAQMPGDQITAPVRPPELGGAGAAGGLTPPQVPAFNEQTQRVAEATAEVAKYEGELAKVRSQLDGLKASGEGAFSPETFTLESKMNELESAVDKAKSKLEELKSADFSSLNGAVDETKAKMDQLGSTTVTPKVDPSSIASATSAASNLLNLLGQIESKANSASAAVTTAAGNAAKATATLQRAKQTSMTSSPA